MSDRLELKAAITVTETGHVTGLAWPFNTPDRVGDVIEKGAFTGTPMPLPMLWSHDQAQVIGVWDEIEETAEGLTVKGRLLVEDVARAREVRAMILEKAATGLSIGFHTKAANPRTRGRTITALDLLEVSIVAVPCHPAARITSAKSAEDDAAPSTIGEIMDPEKTQAATPASTTPANDAPGFDFKAFDQMRARLDAIEAKTARPGVVISGPAVATGERKAFETFVRRGVERMTADEVKALSVSTDASGGYLAPEEFGAEMLKALVEFSPIRRYARVINISASEIVYPRRVTGTGAVWTTETADRTASSPTYEQLRIAPHELATYVDVSNALLEDNAYNLEGELISDFAESFGKTEGAAFVNGTGTNQPTGIMAATGLAEINTGVADDFHATAPADALIKMYHAIPQTYASNGVWIMNRLTLSTIRTWKDSMGRYLVVDPISAGAPSTLLGRPIVEAVDMPNVAADAFPIIFGDLSGYRIVDRLGLSTLRDPFSLASKGQVRIHARKRVGADLTHPDRFVKLKVAA
ncbi:phage major capsid protein [Mameliella sp. AT18]|uniref:phage major capsid protein n=1 Tax=Mameliella sp. AT18 TaxID=3028385 RepID=UPI00237A39C4|nr:phage major capsid protein [Mameliella sp. AT18]MDD9730456.1 phage major capsid protein [Mameliella sp. AT18]